MSVGRQRVGETPPGGHLPLFSQHIPEPVVTKIGTIAAGTSGCVWGGRHADQAAPNIQPPGFYPSPARGAVGVLVAPPCP